ncbi:aminotransferase class V-fold PLP-dependent enzyme [Dyadobacter sp. CY261]|uniref:aminotransferase class V-fold PLP-dependent enzyme n=1 Tax=Dyadobacter sp. CY261 TaxID=2907203 RepID=UPI001F360CE6|nr:aminotransferase class V-fold PLP-dependent enzyme [Dyadobacter sp. CY261]MCF0070611.1 aminotransferase class V-fold PLP-dependent enzyme [Dyadobacter sp. CY261]
MKRRKVIQSLSTLPLFGALPLAEAGAKSVSKKRKRDVIAELGIRSFINAAGTLTYMSGCIMHDEVVETIDNTSKHFCMIDEVQDKVGEKIAKLVHSEAAMVTCGAFSAMTLGLAGVLTGLDVRKAEQLPHLTGTDMKSEVICQKCHNERYNHAFLNTGCTVVEVETIEDVEKAISEKTALLHFLNITAHAGQIKYEEWVALGKKHHIPTSIDIAADVPPVSNLWKFNEMGFDMVFISGGKAMRGPQSAGILMGRKDIVAAARLNAPPRGFTVARGHKVNKEEILGMYVALEKFISGDHDREWTEWEAQIARIEGAVKGLPGITTSVTVPELGNITPTLTISWDDSIVKVTGRELRDKLRFGNPSIEAGFSGLPLYYYQAGSDSIDPAIEGTLNGASLIRVTAWMLQPGEDKIVARRIREEILGATAG